MFLSKNAKRFMSTAAVLAMTVASLVVAPKAQAAEGDPTVGPETISDAKVSVNETGTGIRYMVSATLAKDYSEDLGIELTAGTNATKTISLKNGAKKLYSRTENEDGSVTVQYAVAVTNIPAAQKDTAIKAQGFASTSVANEVSYTVTEAAKIAGYTFGADGSLTSLGGTKGNPAIWYYTQLPKIDSAYAGKTVSISFKVRAQGKYISTPISTSVSIPHTPDGGTVSYSRLGGVTISNDWTTCTINKYAVPEGGNLGAPYIDGNGAELGADIYYDDFEVTEVEDVPIDYSKPVALDLSTYAKFDGNSSYTGGTIVINDSTGNSTGYIDLPKAVESGKEITVKIKGAYTGDSGFRIWLGNGPNAFSTPAVFNTDNAPQGEFEETCTFTATAKSDKLTIKGIPDWQGGKGYINGLTISKITVLYPQNS